VSTVYARTLRRAADYAGGVEGLARQLKVKAVHLIAWIEGVETPPMEIFLKAVDIVTERFIPSPLNSPPSRDASIKKPGSWVKEIRAVPAVRSSAGWGLTVKVALYVFHYRAGCLDSFTQLVPGYS
jgi:hypothetical protein